MSEIEKGDLPSVISFLLGVILCLGSGLALTVLAFQHGSVIGLLSLLGWGVLGIFLAIKLA